MTHPPTLRHSRPVLHSTYRSTQGPRNRPRLSPKYQRNGVPISSLLVPIPMISSFLVPIPMISSFLVPIHGPGLIHSKLNKSYSLPNDSTNPTPPSPGPRATSPPDLGQPDVDATQQHDPLQTSTRPASPPSTNPHGLPADEPRAPFSTYPDRDPTPSTIADKAYTRRSYQNHSLTLVPPSHLNLQYGALGTYTVDPDSAAILERP